MGGNGEEKVCLTLRSCCLFISSYLGLDARMAATTLVTVCQKRSWRRLSRVCSSSGSRENDTLNSRGKHVNTSRNRPNFLSSNLASRRFPDALRLQYHSGQRQKRTLPTLTRNTKPPSTQTKPTFASMRATVSGLHRSGKNW